jgi:cyclic pyranopterin phosphate synthase
LNSLIDRFGRKITYIRFSVTPRCNFNCSYCTSHTSENDPAEEFKTEDIAFLFGVAGKLGIEKVRLTGGEPLLRKDIVEIVSALHNADNVKEIVLTTNGYYLKFLASRLKEAGLTRVNISLDTLRRDVFKQITRVDGFDLTRAGIEESIKVGLVPVKINTVLLKGINEDDIVPIAELSLHYPVIVRFIELMPVKGNNFWKDHYMGFSEALFLIKKKYKLESASGAKGEVASYYKIIGSNGKVGFITPVSQHFCAQCNRIRITAAGKIYPCLFSKDYVSIWDAVKARDSNLLEKLIKEAVYIKPKEHGPIDSDDQDFINNMRELGG